MTAVQEFTEAFRVGRRQVRGSVPDLVKAFDERGAGPARPLPPQSRRLETRPGDLVDERLRARVAAPDAGLDLLDAPATPRERPV